MRRMSGANCGVTRRHHAEVVEQHHAGVFRARAQEQPGLEGHETHRHVGAHGRLVHGAAVGIDAGRNIERQHRALRGVDRADHGQCFRPRRAREPDA